MTNKMQYLLEEIKSINAVDEPIAARLVFKITEVRQPPGILDFKYEQLGNTMETGQLLLCITLYTQSMLIKF